MDAVADDTDSEKTSRRRKAEDGPEKPPKKRKFAKQPPDPLCPKSIIRRRPPKRDLHVRFNDRVKYIFIEKVTSTDEDGLFKDDPDVELDEEGHEIAEDDSKHTLDSDEEEEPDHTVLDTNRVDGQEEATIAYDGDTKIMPFNMDEDLEEGDFDTAGNFIRDKKKADELKDPWYNSVNWKSVEMNEHTEPVNTNFDYDSDDSQESLDEEGMNMDYIALVKLLDNGETPAAAMKRIVTQRPSEKEMRKLRFAAKKEGKKFVDTAGEHIEAINEYTSRIQRSGYYNILNTPKEDIQKLIEEHEIRKEANRSLDNVVARLYQAEAGAESSESDSEATYWEYEKPGVPDLIFLKDTTKNMIKMLKSGQISGDTLCRRVGTDNFYKAERSEFELFLDL